MNTNPQDELFSAYYDGETSPEERAQAEEKLETSDAARQELEEIGELSSLLQSLPTQTVPAELASSVMKRAERESLLPTPALAVQKQPPRRSRFFLGISLVATAATVLLVGFFINRPAPPGIEQEKIASSDAMELAQTDDLGVAREAGEGASFGGASLEKAMGDSSVENDVAVPTVVVNPTPADSIESFSKSEINHSHLQKVEIGDVIPYFAVSDGQVAVVEVTVIDVQKAIGATQLLLEQNQIPKLSKKTKESGIAGGGFGGNVIQPARIQKTGDGLFAVYIESTQSQLEQTMRQLDQKGILAELRLRPPIELKQVELAELETSSNESKRGLSEQQKEKGSTLAEAVAQGRAQQSVRSPSQGRPSLPPRDLTAAKEKRKAKASKESTESKLSKKITPPVTDQAFQMLVNVHSKSLNQQAKTADKNQALPKPAVALGKDAKKENATTKAAASDDDAEAAPIRLILIFQELPPVEAPKPK